MKINLTYLVSFQFYQAKDFSEKIVTDNNGAILMVNLVPAMQVDAWCDIISQTNITNNAQISVSTMYIDMTIDQSLVHQ